MQRYSYLQKADELEGVNGDYTNELISFHKTPRWSGPEFGGKCSFAL